MAEVGTAIILGVCLIVIWTWLEARREERLDFTAHIKRIYGHEEWMPGYDKPVRK